MIRHGVLFLMLAGTALLVGLHRPANLALGRGALQACPVALGPWDGSELSFDRAVVEELDADDILVRRYQRGLETVWLCVVYHQNRRYGAHDPKLCYESQGYLVEPGSPVQVDDGRAGGLTVNRFVAERAKDQRVVLFWWAARDLATADVSVFRRRLALTGALENSSWGAFVRVEAQVRGGDLQAAETAAADFASQVARAFPTWFENPGTTEPS